MKKVLFVLKDNDIYDVWVSKAQQLKFQSLDGNDASTTNPSTQQNTKIRERTKEPDTSNPSFGLKVIDFSTADKPSKSGERTRDKSPPTASSHPSDAAENPVTEGDSSTQNKGGKANEQRRYTIHTAESMVFVIYSLKIFTHEHVEQ